MKELNREELLKVLGGDGDTGTVTVGTTAGHFQGVDGLSSET
jgi:hypothetical protein